MNITVAPRKKNYDTAMTEFKKLPDIGSLYSGTSLFGLINGYVAENKVLYFWIKAGKPTEGNEYQDKVDQLAKIEAELNKVANAENKQAIKTAYDELVKLAEKAREKQWEMNKTEQDYRAQQPYQTYSEKNTAYSDASKAVTSAQNYFSIVKNTVEKFWIRWDYAKLTAPQA